MADSVVIDGVRYVREVPRPTGTRRVVVISESWIFAGDVTTEGDRMLLDRVVHVGKWTGGQWFAGMIADPTKNVELRRMSERIEVPVRAVLYSVVVPDDWGL